MKLLVLAFASLLTTNNSYSMEAGTNALAYTLAETLYTTAVVVKPTEDSSNTLSSKERKLESQRIQNEVQQYLQTGFASLYLESKIQIARDLDKNLSELQAVDLLLEASKIL